MLYADGALALVLLVLWVFALLDVLTTPPERVRNLPKWGWFVVVLLLGELAIGPVLWCVAGRPRGPGPVGRRRGGPRAGGRSGTLGGPAIPAEYDRPGRASASSPDDDAAFLAALKARADEQRRQAERERRHPDA